jgi:magnesium-dependent phosphatase-1
MYELWGGGAPFRHAGTNPLPHAAATTTGSAAASSGNRVEQLAKLDAVAAGQRLVDCRGQQVHFLGDTRAVLEALYSSPDVQSGNTVLALASTTDEAAWANECLTKFHIVDRSPSLPVPRLVALRDVFAVQEVYKAGNKGRHFRSIQEKCGGVDFSEMVFWDNQRDNCAYVGAMGVRCVYCPDGVTWKLWEAHGLPKAHLFAAP